MRDQDGLSGATPLLARAWRSAAYVLRLILGSDYLLGMIVYSAAEELRANVSRVWGEFTALVTNRLFTYVRLGDEQTRELMAYLRSQPRVTRNSAALSLRTTTATRGSGGAKGARSFGYEPELNSSLRFTHQRRWLWTANYEYGATPQKPAGVSTTLAVFGRDKRVIEAVLDEGRRILTERRRTHLHIIPTYNYKENDYGLGWNPCVSSIRVSFQFLSNFLPKHTYPG